MVFNLGKLLVGFWADLSGDKMLNYTCQTLRLEHNTTVIVLVIEGKTYLVNKAGGIVEHTPAKETK